MITVRIHNSVGEGGKILLSLEQHEDDATKLVICLQNETAEVDATELFQAVRFMVEEVQ